jgi:hypothetical protein
MVVVADNVQPQTQALPPLPLQQNVPEVPAAAPPQIMQLQILGHDKLLKGYVKEPEPYGPPDQLTWFLKSQINATKIAILTELNIKITKKNPVQRELVELLRKQFLDIEGLGIDDAIKRCSQLCTSKNIIFIPFVTAIDDQLNPMSGVTQDTLLFNTAPQRQDAIEMLSNE